MKKIFFLCFLVGCVFSLSRCTDDQRKRLLKPETQTMQSTGGGECILCSMECCDECSDACCMDGGYDND